MPRMTQCKVCMLLKDAISKEVNMESRQSLLIYRNEHLNRQQKEREAYYQRRTDAEKNPDEILSIIIDGMDQKKGDLPHFKGYADPKGIGQYKLKTHFTGALCHANKKMYTLVDLCQYCHDTNLTLTCLLHTLHKESKDGKLPAKLYVQLDNCVRENKNKFFIGFMAYLVKRKYLQEIMMSFLMVGHTHEDIDQRFSKYSQKLKENDAKTMPELAKVLENSTDPQPEITILQTVWNIRDWLLPHLEEIHNQSFPHVYRIYLASNGEVKVQYKNWSTDFNWQPEDGLLEIFKKENGLQSIPEGYPDIAPMTFDDAEIRKVRQSIAKSKDVLSFAQFEWWRTFLDSPKTETVTMSNQTTNWYLDELYSYRPAPPAVTTTSPEETDTIQRLLTREREGRQVTNSIRQQRGRRETRRLGNRPARSRPACRVPIAIGNMAIIRIDGDKVIGKVVSKLDGIISLEVYRNVGSGVYRPVIQANGDVTVRSGPMSCVLHSFRSLTSLNKLPRNMAQALERLQNTQD
ncbi:uncharacterized protein [Ptychodera flava]|uniref:uncharacterized protein n=1 Tax=Ptychodera flava TaxID=63121 RepID=UPI00396AAAD0